MNTDQLKGKAVSASTLDSSTCKPLSTISGKPVYPCGLIANSLFNGARSFYPFIPWTPHVFIDTISNPVLLNPSDGRQPEIYIFSDKGIAWPGEARKYGPTQYNLSEIVPPPNWMILFPNGYNNNSPPLNLQTDERFQNWMRTAGLPTFSKLYGRNDTAPMSQGNYNISIGMSE